MELYIDTTNIDEIRRAAALGVLDGVTTNPSLVAKEGVDFHTRLKEICQVVKGPVSAEVVSLEHDGMIAEAEVLTAIADNICIKLPCIEASKRMMTATTTRNTTKRYFSSLCFLCRTSCRTLSTPDLCIFFILFPFLIRLTG